MSSDRPTEHDLVLTFNQIRNDLRGAVKYLQAGSNARLHGELAAQHVTHLMEYLADGEALRIIQAEADAVRARQETSL